LNELGTITLLYPELVFGNYIFVVVALSRKRGRYLVSLKRQL